MKKITLALLPILLLSCGENLNIKEFKQEQTQSGEIIDIELAEDHYKITDYSNLSEKNIELVEFYRQKAREQTYLLDYDRAIEYYKKLKEILNDDFEADYRIGVLLRRQEKIEESTESHARVLDTNPELAFVVLPLIAQNYGFLGQDDLKEIYLNKAIEQNPDYFFIYEVRDGSKEMTKSEQEEYIINLEIRFNKFYNDPKNSNLIELFQNTWKYGLNEVRIAHNYESLAHRYYKDEEYTEAAKFFKKAYETALYQNGVYMAGKSLYYGNKLKESEETFLELEKINPYGIRYYPFLLNIYGKSGEKSKMEIYLFKYKDAFELYENNGYWNPESTFAKYNFIYDDTKDWYMENIKKHEEIFKNMPVEENNLKIEGEVI